MLGNLFTVPIHVPGTLAANIDVRFILPVDCSLVHVSACGSNANNGILDVGPSTDTDGYLDGVDIGDSQVPTEFDRDNFVGTQYAHITKGTIIVVTLDYDGSSGTATANFTCVLTFLEG
jgi:hypothetical protein